MPGGWCLECKHSAGAGRRPRDLFLLLHRCEPAFVPLEKLFFGTDYPGFLYDPVKLRDKLITVNEEAAAVRLPPIPEEKVEGIGGTNFARVINLIENGNDPSGELLSVKEP